MNSGARVVNSALVYVLRVRKREIKPSGSPLNFRSALSGPYHLQWLLASDTELVKLVETARTLCPVHSTSSSPTYFNPIPKEKRSPPPSFSPTLSAAAPPA
jgi:hypothetical protein